MDPVNSYQVFGYVGGAILTTCASWNAPKVPHALDQTLRPTEHQRAASSGRRLCRIFPRSDLRRTSQRNQLHYQCTISGLAGE